jgi:DNA (cytosine-5)-methyltransferase 1|nr:MAG TPA: Cytosine specific methyltransferase [Caudoviricetes sp.]
MIKVFEAFAGYGSQSMALRRLGIDFEVVGISEIDKHAIQAYMAVHGDTSNYGDISKIDWSSVSDFDFLTYSFPCTDISTAGQQKGLAEGSGTRSSLLWECRKAIEAKRPKYLLMENVKNLISKKFTPYLKEWLRFLEGQGYSNYTKVLNAKDFGVPQNRERVFMVSILGEASFHFPKPFTLEKRLKDVLEKDVDESFYLSEKIVKTFLTRDEKNKAKGNGFKFEPTMGDVIASSILTNAGSRDCDNYVYVVGNTNPSGHGMNGNVFDSNGLCPILTTNKGEGPRILESSPTDLNSKGKKYGNKRVPSLVDSGKISGHEVQFLDAYNQTVSDICGTIKTTVDSSCLSFISEPINQALIIKQATKKGYIEIPTGGVFDASYPESLTRRGRVQDNGKVCPTLTAGGEPPCLYEGMEQKCVAYTRDSKGKVISRRLSDIANTVHGSTGCGGSTDCFVAEPKIIQVGNFLDDKGFENPQRGRVYDINGLAPNIDTFQGGGRVPKIIDNFTNYRIRKLTPRECFRLMGVSEKDIDNIQKSGISKTQQYKMAGNSIVVDVLYYIFKKMFVDKSCEDAQLSLF